MCQVQPQMHKHAWPIPSPKLYLAVSLQTESCTTAIFLGEHTVTNHPRPQLAVWFGYKD